MENRAGKLATLAAASVGLVGATAVLEPQSASASFSPPAKIFETRGQAAVRPDEIPLPSEHRPASPMPFGGAGFGEDFDESVEMTSGERQASSPSRTFPPPPAQWNNPIQWLATHKP